MTMNGQPGCTITLLVGLAIFVFLRMFSDQQAVNDLLPGRWRRRWGRLTSLWNGHPASAQFQRNVDSPEVWIVIELGVHASAELQVYRRKWLDVDRHPLPLILIEPSDELEVRGDDPELARRLFADPVMARTLPLALSKRGEELAITLNAVRVRRLATGMPEKDALQSAWSLATAVISTLQLPPPR